MVARESVCSLTDGSTACNLEPVGIEVVAQPRSREAHTEDRHDRRRTGRHQRRARWHGFDGAHRRESCPRPVRQLLRPCRWTTQPLCRKLDTSTRSEAVGAAARADVLPHSTRRDILTPTETIIQQEIRIMLTTFHRSPVSTARRVSVAITICAVMLMSCGDDSSSSTAPTKGDLADRSFLSSNVDGQTLVDGTQITLTFTADTVSAVAGCNTMTGNYTIEDGTLKVDTMAQTRMACDPDTTSQDVWLQALLASRPAVTLSTNELVLKGGDTTLTLRDRTKVANENALDGRSWDLVTLDAAQAPEGAYLSIAGGQLYLATGCNRGFGTVTVTDTAIEVGPIALTRRSCDPALNEWEQSLTTFLTGSLEYDVSGADVTLDNGTQTLTLAEVPVA